MRSPNLVYVFADQLRYQSCGYAGDERARTPNIDRFSREGVNFRQCVSGSPMCAPYRASLFTGKYSSSTGMVINELRMNPGPRACSDGGPRVPPWSPPHPSTPRHLRYSAGRSRHPYATSDNPTPESSTIRDRTGRPPRRS